MDTLLCLVLVALTGHDSFRVREAASVSLERQGTLAAPALLLGWHAGCPETQARCWHLLRPLCRHFPEAASEWVKPRGGWPWIDGATDAPVCWSEMGELLSRARQAGFTDAPPDWPCYREATRLLVLRRLRDGEVVGPTLEWLRERERYWRAVNNYPPPP
jgi:hypothetical protein